MGKLFDTMSHQAEHAGRVCDNVVLRRRAVAGHKASSTLGPHPHVRTPHGTPRPQGTHTCMLANTDLNTHTHTRARKYKDKLHIFTNIYSVHNIPRCDSCLLHAFVNTYVPLAPKATAPLDVCVPAIQELLRACVQDILCVQSLRGLPRFTSAAAGMRVRVCFCVGF